MLELANTSCNMERYVFVGTKVKWTLDRWKLTFGIPRFLVVECSIRSSSSGIR